MNEMEMVMCELTPAEVKKQANVLLRKGRLTAVEKQWLMDRLRAAPLGKWYQDLTDIEVIINPDPRAFGNKVFLGTWSDGHRHNISQRKVVEKKSDYVKRKLRNAVLDDTETIRKAQGIYGNRKFDVDHLTPSIAIIAKWINLRANKLFGSGDELVEMCRARQLDDWIAFHREYFDPVVRTKAEHRIKTRTDNAKWKPILKKMWKSWFGE